MIGAGDKTPALIILEGNMEENKPIVKKTAAKKAPAKKSAAKKQNQLIVEADPVSIIQEIQDVLLYMKSGHSYYGPDIEFTKEAPFKMINPIEAQRLINAYPDRFCLATKDQVEEFYSLG